MNVKDFREWLEKFHDQEATVSVLLGVNGNGHAGDSFRWVDFDPEKHAKYLDLRGNKFAEGKPYAQNHELWLGGEE
jgi:hypothetical protein